MKSRIPSIDTTAIPILQHLPESYQGYAEQFSKNPDKAISRLRAAIQKRNSGAPGYALLSILCALNGQQNQAIHYAWTAGILAPGSKRFRQLPYMIDRFMLASTADKELNVAERWRELESEFGLPSHFPASGHIQPNRSEYAVGDIDQFIETLSDPSMIRISDHPAGDSFRSLTEGSDDSESTDSESTDSENSPSIVHPHSESVKGKGTQSKDTHSDSTNSEKTSRGYDLRSISIKPTPTATLAKILASQGHRQQAIAIYRDLMKQHPERKEEYSSALEELEKNQDP